MTTNNRLVPARHDPTSAAKHRRKDSAVPINFELRQSVRQHPVSVRRRSRIRHPRLMTLYSS